MSKIFETYKLILIRPDRYVYGGIESLDDSSDIIESLETRLDEFGSLDAGDRRRLMLSIADTKRNLPERATETAIGFLKQPGKEVDEVVGVSSTYTGPLDILKRLK